MIALHNGTILLRITDTVLFIHFMLMLRAFYTFIKNRMLKKSLLM